MKVKFLQILCLADNTLGGSLVSKRRKYVHEISDHLPSWICSAGKSSTAGISNCRSSSDQFLLPFLSPVSGRTKRGCIKRYKELVEMVKGKRAAQEQVLNAVEPRNDLRQSSLCVNFYN